MHFELDGTIASSVAVAKCSRIRCHFELVIISNMSNDQDIWRHVTCYLQRSEKNLGARLFSFFSIFFSFFLGEPNQMVRRLITNRGIVRTEQGRANALGAGRDYRFLSIYALPSPTITDHHRHPFRFIPLKRSCSPTSSPGSMG